MALANYRVKYSSVSNYLFSAITKRMFLYLDGLEEIDPLEDFHLNWLLVDMDVLFFVHAMDIRIRPTDRLARAVYDIVERTKEWPYSFVEIIHKKIFDHVRQAINIFIDHSREINGIETLNLLIILTMLPKEYRLQEKKLRDYFGGLEGGSEAKDFYFRWVTFMLYMEDGAEYKDFREELIRSANSYFSSSDDMFVDSEYFMFYFDYLACPYVDKVVREKTIKEVKARTLNGAQKANFNERAHGQIVLNRDFVVSWRDPDYLKNSLEKKEYLFAYG